MRGILVAASLGAALITCDVHAAADPMTVREMAPYCKADAKSEFSTGLCLGMIIGMRSFIRNGEKECIPGSTTNGDLMRTVSGAIARLERDFGQPIDVFIAVTLYRVYCGTR